MDPEDLFFSRLQLMVIMGYGYLGNYPLGEGRRQAMLENAQFMSQAAIDPRRQSPHTTPAMASGRLPGGTTCDHIFYQRINLLAVMLTGVAQGLPMGEHRRTALRENLDRIRRTLMFSVPSEEDFAILKVA
jgi:hypothetical protein